MKKAPSAPDDPKKFDKAAHLADIHLEKGMQCVDCHFEAGPVMAAENCSPSRAG